MDGRAIVEQYLKITKRFAYLAGTWPYQKTSSKVPILVVTFVIVVVSLTCQITYIVITATLNVVFEEFPFVAVVAGTFIKQVYFGVIYKSELKSLLGGIFEDWSMKRSKEENDIMTFYAKRASYFISFYTVAALSSTFFFMNMPYVSVIMDKLMPLNESREIKLPCAVYYPFDQRKYYYIAVNHQASMILLIMLVFIAVDTMIIYLVQHACGLLEVAGHRFKYAIDVTSISTEKKTVHSAEGMYRTVRYSVQAHQRAITYLKDVQHIFMIFLFIFMTLVTIAFSVTLLKVSALEVNGDTEFCFYCIFLFVQLMHIFFIVYQGQLVINTKDNVYNQIYEGLWYNAPFKTQTLYILALGGTLATPDITAGGLVTFNLESLSTMMKTSFSYFTMLKSI